MDSPEHPKFLPSPLEGKVVTPEIVGLPQPKPTFLRRFLVRVVAGMILGILGVGLCLFGAIFTLSIIGASFGVPMLILGLILIILAVFILVSSGSGRR